MDKKTVYEVIDSIIFNLKEIKQINNEQSAQKQLNKYFAKIYLVYSDDSELIKKLRELIFEIQIEEKFNNLGVINSSSNNNTIQTLLVNIQELLHDEHILQE